MTFVTLWRLSVMIFVAIWRLLHYDFFTIWRTVCRLWLLLPYCVCRLWCLSHFDVCRLWGFMAWCLWRLSQCLLFMWRHTLRIYVQCSNNLSVFSVRHTTVLFFCFIPFIFTVMIAMNIFGMDSGFMRVQQHQ